MLCAARAAIAARKGVKARAWPCRAGCGLLTVGDAGGVAGAAVRFRAQDALVTRGEEGLADASRQRHLP